jgi:hypothetical protein
MGEFIAQRGEDCQVVEMKPLTSPGCYGKRTQFSITSGRRPARQDRGGGARLGCSTTPDAEGRSLPPLADAL